MLTKHTKKIAPIDTSISKTKVLSLVDLPDDILKIIMDIVPVAYKILVRLTCNKMLKFLVSSFRVNLNQFGSKINLDGVLLRILNHGFIAMGDIRLFVKQDRQLCLNLWKPCYFTFAMMAIQYGQLDILKYLWSDKQVRPFFMDQDWEFDYEMDYREAFSYHAAIHEHIHILKWLKERGILSEKMHGVRLLENGGLAAFRWLHENHRIFAPFGLGCLSRAAAPSADLSFFQWLKEKGEPIGLLALQKLVEFRNADFLESVYDLLQPSDAVEVQTESGYYNLLQPNEITKAQMAEIAVEYGTVRLLEKLVKQDILHISDESNPLWIYRAIKGGRLENLIWLSKRGCEIHIGTSILDAINYDRVHIMELLLGLMDKSSEQLDDEVRSEIYHNLLTDGTPPMCDCLNSHGFFRKNKNPDWGVMSFAPVDSPQLNILIYLCESNVGIDEDHLFRQLMHLWVPDDEISGVLTWGAQTKRPSFVKLIEQFRQEMSTSAKPPMVDNILEFAKMFGI